MDRFGYQFTCGVVEMLFLFRHATVRDGRMAGSVPKHHTWDVFVASWLHLSSAEAAGPTRLSESLHLWSEFTACSPFWGLREAWGGENSFGTRFERSQWCVRAPTSLWEGGRNMSEVWQIFPSPLLRLWVVSSCSAYIKKLKLHFIFGRSCVFWCC